MIPKAAFNVAATFEIVLLFWKVKYVISANGSANAGADFQSARIEDTKLMSTVCGARKRKHHVGD
ncbi:hypothetical protein CEQ90_20020 [Lewinellaceae bacterium SD302]|nr:hypothetical protein CEQ90_20020 [Lewinellaceae bacterium SD302]